MIASLFDASGRSTGLTTSPHLERVNERIVWNDEPIVDDELARVLTQIAGIEEFLTESPSYFEIMTAAAFPWFADVAVDVAVVEVGLGGTWDATNVVDAPIAVVTNVELDHVEYLGATRAEIAAEKAGIVEPEATLVLGETDPALRPIFEARNPERLVVRDVDFGVVSNQLAHRRSAAAIRHSACSLRRRLPPAPRRAPGRQRRVRVGRRRDRDRHRARRGLVFGGFARVESPGRLEVVGTQPLVLLDGAHNVAGAAALRRRARRGVPRRAAHARRRA